MRTVLATLAVVSAFACSSGSTSPSIPSGSGGSSSGGSSGAASSGSGGGSGGGSSSSGSGSGAGSSSSSGGGSNSGSGSGGGSGSSSGADGDGGISPQQLCVDTINMYRATLKPAPPPYKRWTAAESCVDGQAKADSTGGAHSAFGKCGENAQDECPGWPGPPAAVIPGCFKQMWAEGPGAFNQGHGHYDNMSSTQYTQVACGFYTLPNGSVWAAQDFK